MLFISIPAIVHLYHGENKLLFNEMYNDEVCFELEQHA
jgi:hypothetical protein